MYFPCGINKVGYYLLFSVLWLTSWSQCIAAGDDVGFRPQLVIVPVRGNTAAHHEPLGVGFRSQGTHEQGNLDLGLGGNRVTEPATLSLSRQDDPCTFFFVFFLYFVFLDHLVFSWSLESSVPLLWLLSCSLG